MDAARFEIYIERAIQGWRQFFFDAFTALRVNGISGDYAEFGSQSGTTMTIAHREIEFAEVSRHMWAFDSFEGLPQTDEPRDEHPSFIRGGAGDGLSGFLAKLDQASVPREAYTVVEGLYSDSLSRLGEHDAPTDIALAYIDCNLYSSTVSVLDFLRPRLKHGMIIAMDDWFCWSATQRSGEQIALEEFERNHPEWHFERFKEVSWGGLSFVVQDADAA